MLNLHKEGDGLSRFNVHVMNSPYKWRKFFQIVSAYDVIVDPKTGEDLRLRLWTVAVGPRIFKFDADICEEAAKRFKTNLLYCKSDPLVRSEVGKSRIA